MYDYRACMPLEAVVPTTTWFYACCRDPRYGSRYKGMCAAGRASRCSSRGKRISTHGAWRVPSAALDKERISWDEAINTICEKIKGYQNNSGKAACVPSITADRAGNLYNLYRLRIWRNSLTKSAQRTSR
ncbi:MAG: hypothetical protein ACLU6V_00530 [Lancefieldella rimae]